jgi:hypothetical protein
LRLVIPQSPILPSYLTQEVQSCVQSVLEVAQRLLPLGVVFTPRSVFQKVPYINIAMTFITTGTVSEKAWSCKSDIAAAVAEWVSKKNGSVFISFITYCISNCIALKQSISTGNQGARNHHLVNLIEVGLYVSHVFSKRLKVDKSTCKMISLAFQGFHHGYNAFQAYHKVTTWKSLAALECGVQLSMLIIRLGQAWKEGNASSKEEENRNPSSRDAVSSDPRREEIRERLKKLF